MIIVEGPDGSGKSTLVRAMQERFGLREGERGTRNRKLLYKVTVPDTYRALNRAIRGTQKPYIWDRLFYSEFVYYPLTGRECQFSEGQRQHINRIIEALEFPIIVCLPPVDVVIENARKDEQMDGVIENLSKIYIAYVTMMRWMPPHMVVYDYMTEDYDRMFQIVDSYLTRRHAREW